LLDRQQHALTEAGCIRIFADKLSGKNADRPELAACLDYLRPGDTLVVPSLDRLSRSLADLIEIVGTLRRHGIGFRSLHEALDTTTPGGRLIFHVFAALAEFIRELIVEGTREGLNAARARGVRLGRPPAMTAEQIQHARDLLARPENTVSSIARLLGVSRATIYKYVPNSPRAACQPTTGPCPTWPSMTSCCHRARQQPSHNKPNAADLPCSPIAAWPAPRAGPLPALARARPQSGQWRAGWSAGKAGVCMSVMGDDIDPLAAAAYAHGGDPIDVAAERIATLIEVRDDVLRGREENPDSFPGFGPTDKLVIGRRIVASLLDAGWRPPPSDAVEDAANRSRERSARFSQWLDSLTPEQRTRALENYSKNGEFPPDLRPPS
jgi:DNA invertase Pin-like site-specific DNA recombinase